MDPLWNPDMMETAKRWNFHTGKKIEECYSFCSNPGSGKLPPGGRRGCVRKESRAGEERAAGVEMMECQASRCLCLADVSDMAWPTHLGANHHHGSHLERTLQVMESSHWCPWSDSHSKVGRADIISPIWSMKLLKLLYPLALGYDNKSNDSDNVASTSKALAVG